MNLGQKLGKLSPFKKTQLKMENAEKRKTVIDGQPVEDVLKWAKDLLDEAEQNREAGYDRATVGTSVDSFKEEMKRRMYQYLGKHWDLRDDVESDEEKCTENWLFATIETQMPIQLANRPTITYTPVGTEDVSTAETYTQIAEIELDRAEYDLFLGRWLKAAKIFGSAVAYDGYTLLENPPVGKFVYRVCDPLGVFWDAHAESLVQSPYLIEVRPRRVVDVEDEWQVKLPEGEDLFDSPGNYSLWYYIHGVPPSDSVIRRCLEVNIWYHDSTKNEKETPVMTRETDEETGAEIQAKDQDGNLLFDVEQTPVYPGWRRIVFTGNHVLYDGPSQYKHETLVYENLQNYDIPGRTVGMSEFTQLESIQNTINDVVTQAAVNAGLSGNNQRMVDEKALADGFTSANLTNQPGLQVPVKPSRAAPANPAIGIIPQGSVGAQAQVVYSNAVTAIQTVGGTTRISSGMAEPEESGIKVQSLDAYTARRLQRPTQNLEHAVKQQGKRLLKNIVQFLPDSTAWRVTNKKTEKGEMVRLSDLPHDVEMDTRVTPMSSLPSNRDAKLELLVKLKQVDPEIPTELLFKYVDIPELAEEYKRWKEQQEELQMQLAQTLGDGGAEELQRFLQQSQTKTQGKGPAE